MATLIWKAPLRYYSAKDEAAFFTWLQSIPAVVGVRGVGQYLHIQLKSSRLSAESLRELISIYHRYNGYMPELATFLNSKNEGWFKAPESYWYKRVFGAK
jgi:hypothetical protein